MCIGIPSPVISDVQFYSTRLTSVFVLISEEFPIMNGGWGVSVCWASGKRSIGRELLMTMNIYNILAERRLLPPVAVKGQIYG